MQRLFTGLIARDSRGDLGTAATRSLAASPAASSYVGVEKTIGAIRGTGRGPGAPQDPNAPGWNAFFDSLLSDLGEYSRAPSSTARLTPLNRLYQMSPALGTVAWPPA